MANYSRRKILRGVLSGTGVCVGLPFLECFLNTNGTALANGTNIPVRFGTWFWGLGMNSRIFVPKKVGANYDLPEELSSIEPVKKYVNVLSNFNVLRDGKPNLCHYTGWVALRCGSAPASTKTIPNETLDVTIADAIGEGARFKSIELAATGNAKDSFSLRSKDAMNPPETSAVSFYQRLFGADFQDPNAPEFRPNPQVLLRKSVLSAVLEDAQSLTKVVGSADRARLDQHFTALREIELSLEAQLRKPPPAPACRAPTSDIHDIPVGMDVELVGARHKAMTDLLVLAVACNQSRIFNVAYSDSTSGITRKGVANPHHGTTHLESINPKLGYQEEVSQFVRRSIEAWAYLVQAFASVKEGDGTLLDRTLIFAHSDQEFAKIHSIDGIPMMTAGSGGGRIRTGFHVDGKGTVGSRVGLSMIRAMGLPLESWGNGAMKTTSQIDEILV